MENKQDILLTIVEHKKKELEIQKVLLSLAALEKKVVEENDIIEHPQLSMSTSLKKSNTGIIAEFKRKSPSKGWINENSTPEIVPPSYELNGASAISILTDESFFGGDLSYIRRARPFVKNTPILRKDFIIDEYQLFQAKEVGADAVLLIAACLTKDKCKQLAHKAKELSLETLLEVHSENELDWVNDDICMVGVNNRHLGTFHTDIQTSFRLANLLPKDFTLVSESGISNPDTVKELREVGYRGFLIGETFMKTSNPGHSLQNFINQIRQ